MLRGREISAWCFRVAAAGSAAVTVAGGTPKVHQALGSPLSLGLSLSLSLSVSFSPSYWVLRGCERVEKDRGDSCRDFTSSTTLGRSRNPEVAAAIRELET